MYKIIGQAINLRYIANNIRIPEELSEESKRIIRISEFGLKHCYIVAIEAFGISKTRYYEYLKLYKYYQEYGIAPRLKSKRPNNIRRANWDKRIVRFIVAMRNKFANIGKNKIKYYLDKYCIKHKIQTISAGTIQNIINSFANKLRTKKSIKQITRRSDVLRKPRQYKANKSGECVALDSMEFRQNGKKLYVVVVHDEATNLLYAEGTTSHTSRHAKIKQYYSLSYLPKNTKTKC